MATIREKAECKRLQAEGKELRARASELKSRANKADNTASNLEIKGFFEVIGTIIAGVLAIAFWGFIIALIFG